MALTVQAAEAFLIALPLLIKVLGSVLTFLDDGPATFCNEQREETLSFQVSQWSFQPCNAVVD